MPRRILAQSVIGILILVHSSALAYGETYYVRRDGSNGNTGLTNTADGAWLSVSYAVSQVSAGDVVRVQEGAYPERVAPGVSGMAGNPITFVADGAVTFCGMNVSSRNYLRIIGFTIDTDAAGCTKNSRAIAVSGTNTGLEFWNNTIRDANFGGITHGSFADRHHNFIVIGNTFSGIGPGGAATSLRGNNNVLAYNEIRDGVDPDAFIIDGTYSYWLNNYIVMTVTGGNHGDVFQAGASSLGLGHNLFEANFIVGEGDVSDEHGALLQSQSAASCSTGICGAMTENLFRRNVWHNLSGSHLSADTSVVGPITNTREAHDTIVGTMRTSPGATYSAVFRAAGNTAFLYNNINYKAWSVGLSVNIRGFVTDTGASITGAGYNLAFDPDATLTFTAPWTLQAKPQSNANPSFVDIANDNFTLLAASSARGTAGPLTTTSGSGTGTTFNVAIGGGGWFRGPNAKVTAYGGALTEGDVITVGTDTRTVTSVSGDAITVTPSFTWAHGDPVYLGTSATPDIGAYPYKEGGHSLTSRYAVSDGTATVIPSDASLVRFVVCYQDGIPTTVDNSSPYTCPVGTGSVDVRVYPRYASKTRFIAATLGPTAAPMNLRIVP